VEIYDKKTSKMTKKRWLDVAKKNLEQMGVQEWKELAQD
jgi:hypothetical protein